MADLAGAVLNTLLTGANQPGLPGPVFSYPGAAKPAAPAVLDASTSAAGGSGTGGGADPAAAALYDQEARSYEAQLGNLDPALAQTLSDIASGHNKAVNSQGQAFQDATDQYHTTKANDTANEQQTQENIFNSVRNQTNALQRLLGLAGSGNSSASTVAAPYLVGKEGADQNRAAQTTFGQNEQGLDTSYARATRDNKTALDNIDQQQFAATNSAKGSNASQRAGLLQSIIQALGAKGSASGQGGDAVTATLQPFIDQLNAAVKAAAGFTGQYQAPVYQTNPSVYAPPTLASYAAGITPAPTTPSAPAPNAGQNITTAPNPNQKPQSILTALA